MAEAVFQLVLNQEQRSQFYAHILTYLYCLTLKPSAPRNKATIDLLQEVGIRLRSLWGDERDHLAFPLRFEEVQAMFTLLTTLQPLYEQWLPEETSAMALDHLLACRLLLDEAERHANKGTEERQQDR